MLSRGELRGRVLRYLNKTPSHPGFYNEQKVNDAIQEALNFISVEMFLASEGWLTAYAYFDTVAGQTSVDLTGNIAMIREVRYKVSDVWYSIPYDDQESDFSGIGTGIQQPFASRYRLLGRQIVFDPPVAEGGTRYLQVEYVAYPTVLLDDNEIIDPQFDAACCEYLKYRVCSILSASIEKEFLPWAKQEQDWYDKMQAVITRRTLASVPIREFL